MIVQLPLFASSTYHRSTLFEYCSEKRSLRSQYAEFYIYEIRRIWQDNKLIIKSK